MAAKHTEPSSFLNGVTDNIVRSINFGPAKITPGTGGKNIPVFNSLARKILMVRVPQMFTWGAEETEFEPGKKKYNLSLQFPSEMTPEMVALLKNLKEFEAHVKKSAVDNSVDWFKKKMSPEVVDALFAPMLRYRKIEGTSEPNLASPPTLNVKIPMWDGVFKCEVFNLEGQLLFPSDTGVSITDLIPKSSHASIIMKCGGIWFAGGKFGVTWQLYQAAVRQKAQLARGVCHIFGEDSEVKKKAKPDEKLPEEAVKKVEDVGLTVADSDDEIKPEI